MATKKATTKKTTAKKAPAKKTPEKAAPSASAKKATEKKAPAEKAPVEKKAPAKKAPAKKAPAKKTAVKAAAEKKAPAKEPSEKSAAPAAAPVKQAAASEVVVKETPAPVRTAPAVSSGFTAADAEKILAEVRAARKHPKGPCRAAQPLRFTNARRPSSVGDLGPNELRQIVAAGADGTGEARTPEGWLDPDAESFHGNLEVWDVVDAHGIHVYSVWMYLTDNGTVFRAGTIDVVGGVKEGGLESSEEGLEEALLDAKSRVDKKVLQSSLLRNMG